MNESNSSGRTVEYNAIPPRNEIIDLTDTDDEDENENDGTPPIINLPTGTAGCSTHTQQPGPSMIATQTVDLLCAICCDTYIGRNPVSTQCGHIFCFQCLKASLLK